MKKTLTKQLIVLCVLNSATHGVEKIPQLSERSSQKENFNGADSEVLRRDIDQLTDPKLKTILHDSLKRSASINTNMDQITNAAINLDADPIPTQKHSALLKPYPEQRSKEQISLVVFRRKLASALHDRSRPYWTGTTFIRDYSESVTALTHTKFQIECHIYHRLMAYSIIKITTYLEEAKDFVYFIQNIILKGRDVSEIEKLVFQHEVSTIQKMEKFSEKYAICEPDSRKTGTLMTTEMQEDAYNRGRTHQQLKEQYGSFSPIQLVQMKQYYTEKEPQH
jgi:hypothetical protein